MSSQVASQISIPKIVPLVSSHTILVLSGFLFGLCISGTFDSEIKRSFVLAGATGLMCYLALDVARRVQEQNHQRAAIIHLEERLERHAHVDGRSSEQLTATV